MASIRNFFRRAYSFRRVFFRGAIFAAAWYFLPAWLFVLVTLGLYFMPFFQSTRFLSAFLGVLVIYALAPATVAYALIGGAVFAWLLAIREMLFIDRKSSFEILAIVLSFFLLRLFYIANSTVGGGLFLGAMGVAVLIGWMAHALVGLTEKEIEGHSLAHRLVGWLAMLLAAEFIMACLFLPLDAVYQSVIVFLLVVLVIDLMSASHQERIPRSKVLLSASVVFGALVLVLVSAPLGL